MSDKFQNKYRIASARLLNWNYGSHAMYFVTVCTANRACYFGDIVDGVMILSEIGEIVEKEWIKTDQLRPEMNLQMGEFRVMPNHFHAIIAIGENKYNTKCDDNTVDGSDGVDGRDAMHRVSTGVTGITDPTGASGNYKNKFGPQSKNLASIIRGFKSAVTVDARTIYADFAWQPRFHDHIIRNDISFHRISNYIKNNPSNWEGDKFFR